MNTKHRLSINDQRVLQASARPPAIVQLERFVAGIVMGLSILLAAVPCNSGEESKSSGTLQPTKLVNKVWAVADSPGGPSGDLYVFLSEGTLVIASAEAARPIVGRWSWDGHRLTMSETSMPYRADILSLTDTEFRFRATYDSLGSGEFLLVPAPQSMPDTTRTVEFEPSEYNVFAQGNDPAWLLSVVDGAANLRTREGNTVFTEGSWEGEDAHTWIFTAHRHGAGGIETLSLTISTERCVLAPSGATFPLGADLVIPGKEFKGCALAGK
ncbi:MAG: hypothetical protein NTW97_01325 [Candidatus Krumholzibacteria bacterium]|nr:hypothetical protein [Candidatus Krumholzibacteria bacterium]